MIKGIRKQMIEVSEVNHPYYERAFLIVKPEYSSYKERILKKEAKKVIRRFELTSLPQKRAHTFGMALKMSLAAGIGAGITALVML